MDFLLGGFFRRAENRRVEAFKHVECTRDALKTRCVCTRCVEIGRFMPQLIDSPRYCELYDFYKKSMLRYVQRRSVSSFHRYDFNVVTHVLLITVSLIAAMLLRGSMIRAIRSFINNTPYDFYRTE